MELSFRKVLFSKVKIPGWLAILWGIFTWVPDWVSDWQTRIQFWLEAAKKMSDNMALIVSVVTSPWSGFVLIVLGVSYLLFVGEPKRTVRHPLVPVLGWSVVGLVAFMFWSVLVAGYVATHLPPQADVEAAKKMGELTQSNEQLGSEVAKLQEKQRPWRITKKDAFIQALRAVGPVTIDFDQVSDRDAAFLYSDLSHIFADSGWTVQHSATIMGGSWVGVHVVVKDINNAPQEAIALVIQLRANEIDSGLVEASSQADLVTVAFTVKVGYRPQ